MSLCPTPPAGRVAWGSGAGSRPHGLTSFVFLFLSVSALFALTMTPVLKPVLLGGLLAAFASPLLGRISRSGAVDPGSSAPWHPRRVLASRTRGAVFITLGMTVTLIVPASLLLAVVVDRAIRVAGRAPELVRWLEGTEGLASLPFNLRPRDVGAQLSAGASWLASTLPDLVTGVALQALALFLALLTTFYFLKDGPWMLARLERVLPLEERHTRAIVAEFQIVGRSVILGTLAVAALQGTVGGLGYWAMGLPEPLLLGTLTAFASVLPIVGSSVVWVPMAVWLGVTGQPGRAALVCVYGVLVVSLIDNVARPLLTRRGLGVHPLLVILGLFGGVLAFGPSGLYLGPLFVSIFVAVARIYEREHALALAPAPAPAPAPSADTQSAPRAHAAPGSAERAAGAAS